MGHLDPRGYAEQIVGKGRKIISISFSFLILNFVKTVMIFIIFK